MRKRHVGGCLVTLLLAAVPAPATSVQFRTPLPELVARADTIVVGKVAKMQKPLITALATRQAATRTYYQLVEVTISEAILSGKDLTRLKMGVSCAEVVVNRRKQFFPVALLAEGQEACFFLKLHYSGKFYELGLEGMLNKAMNPGFTKDLELTKKYVKLLGEPEESLKSEKKEDRVLTAAMLIIKYRGPARNPFLPPLRKSPKQEPLAAEQSKRLLKVLEEADWQIAGQTTSIHPVNLFRSLGLTAKDGWTLKQRPVSPLNGPAFGRSQKEFAAAAQKWLKTHAEKYRIKRIVEDKRDAKKEKK